MTLSNQLRDAVRGCNRRMKEFEELSAALPSETLSSWQEMVQEWHNEPGKHQDPYQEIANEYSLKDVKKALAEEESLGLPGNKSDAAADDFDATESGFLIRGLEIEEDQ